MWKLNRYTYVHVYFITSTLSKYTYTFQKSTDIVFQEYAILSQFRGGQTSRLQRTAVTRVGLLGYKNYRTPLRKNPWDFCRSTMNKEQLMIDGEASLNPIWNQSFEYSCWLNRLKFKPCLYVFQDGTTQLPAKQFQGPFVCRLARGYPTFSYLFMYWRLSESMKHGSSSMWIGIVLPQKLGDLGDLPVVGSWPYQHISK